jgi:hypothetical protein
LAYQRYGESLFGDRLTWTQNFSANMMRLRVQSGTPSDLGISTLAFSQNTAFGANQNIRDTYDAAGYDDLMRARLYSRQEIAMPLAVGPVKIVPFAHGQVAAYVLNDFQDYSEESEVSHAAWSRKSIFDGVHIEIQLCAQFVLGSQSTASCHSTHCDALVWMEFQQRA